MTLQFDDVTVKTIYGLERFWYDLEMKTREQNGNNKRTAIGRFDHREKWPLFSGHLLTVGENF